MQTNHGRQISNINNALKKSKRKLVRHTRTDGIELRAMDG